MDDQEFKQSLLREHRRYLEQGWTPSKPEQERILRTWRQTSPKMVKRLTALGILKEQAEVAEIQTQREMNDLLKAGYDPASAREEAERAWMMLEPEDETEDETDPLTL